MLISVLRQQINPPSPIGLISMTPWGILKLNLVSILKKIRLSLPSPIFICSVR